jgi:predicted glycoside hydrolase/deacetylase ChbG (UPF0249 family)
MQRGVVRSTTVLANMVTNEEMSWLANMPGISIGAHLNLTKGMPITPFPRDFLNEHGDFSKELIFSPEGGPILPADAVREELNAQMSRLEDVGLSLDHLDSHHHIHGFASVLDVVVELARDRNLAVRPTGPWMSEYLTAKGVRHPERLITGFFGKNNIGEEHLMELLQDMLASGASIVEVMCHPGFSDGLPEGHTGYREERELELQTLCSPGLAAWLNEEGIEVVKYDV